MNLQAPETLTDDRLNGYWEDRLYNDPTVETQRMRSVYMPPEPGFAPGAAPSRPGLNLG